MKRREDDSEIHFVLDAAEFVPKRWARRAADLVDFRGPASHHCNVYNDFR